MMRHLIAPLIVTVLTTGLLPLGANAQSVTLRATSGVSDEVIKYIADISKPAEITIPAGIKPEAFMAAFCGGGLTNTYQEAFYKINGDSFERAPVKKPRKVLAPACVQWRKDTVVPIKSTDTFESVVQREIGIDADAILRPCAPGETGSRCDRTIRQITKAINPQVDFDNLKAAKQIKLPLMSKFITVSLNASAPSPASVVDKLTQLTASNSSSPSGQTLSAAPGVDDIELIAPLNFDLGFSEDTNCKGSSTPFDATKVIAAVTRNRAMVESHTSQQIRSTRVAVLDTGLALPIPELPTRLFDRNVMDVPDNNLDDDNNGYTDDHYGIDARGLGKIAPNSNYKFRQHGWYVADLITGGVQTRQLIPNLEQYLRLKIINLVLTDGNKFEIREGAILRGLQYAARYADIANLSVGSRTKMENILTVAQTQPNLLLVIAAGNEGKDLNIKATYPALLGGDSGRLREQTITVAAHDGNGERASFANFSAQYVDIAAPGCAISQTSGEGSTVKNFGTSMAAPFVTFTAALIRSLGIESPREIKNRIVASAQYVDKLDGIVYAAGVLNPVKAVSLYEDVVEKKNVDKLQTGKWIRPLFVKLCADKDEFDASLVKKITVLPESPPRLRILYQNDDHRLIPYLCKPEGEGITLAPTDGDPVPILWDEIVDFVPRLPLF